MVETLAVAKVTQEEYSESKQGLGHRTMCKAYNLRGR